MIHLVNGRDKERHEEWLSRMYRIRAAVFRDRLKWDVTVEDGEERDRFDDLEPLYLLSIDGGGDHVRQGGGEL